MNCLLSGAIVRIGGAQKRADGVAGAKYSTSKFILLFTNNALHKCVSTESHVPYILFMNILVR